MKTFLEATTTEINLELWLHMRPIGSPCVRLQVGDKILWNEAVTNITHIQHSHDLLTPLIVSIELVGKNYNAEHETALVIEDFCINGISMVPEMTHLFTYENDHGFTSPTNYLGFNGCWKLDTVDCFYRWWHKQSGQGWALIPTTAVHDCVPSSSNTTSS